MVTLSRAHVFPFCNLIYATKRKRNVYNLSQMDTLFLNEIKKADIITIYSHHFPDGDAVGTAMGLRSVLAAAFPEKKIFVLGEDVKKWVRVFGPHDGASDEDVANSLGIVVDHNGPRRCGDRRVATVRQLLRFDHHIDAGDSYPCPTICEVDAVSASQVVLSWCLRVGLPIPKDAIQAFMIAFADDSVQYTEANRPIDYEKQLQIMVDLGGDFAAADACARWKDPAEAAYEKLLLERKVEEGGICYALMVENDYLSIGLSYPAAGVKSSFLLDNTNCRAVLLFTCCAGEVRLSARSKDDYSVEALCAHFGGGGHEQAAGVIFKAENFDLKTVVEEAKRRAKL